MYYAVAAVFYLSCGGLYPVSPCSLFRGIALEYKRGVDEWVVRTAWEMASGRTWYLAHHLFYITGFLGMVVHIFGPVEAFEYLKVNAVCKIEELGIEQRNRNCPFYIFVHYLDIISLYS
jgi:hypothetical protein